MITSGIRSKYLWDTIKYNEHSKLDIWNAGTPVNAPVFVYIPGGGWLFGDRRFQGYQLLSYLVERGWICASVGYRTGVRRWPDQLNDVRDAWNWCDSNLMHYDAGEFMAIGGASAGGHMACLLGLERSANRPDAVVSLYGSYDWQSPRLDHQLINTFVRNVVVGEPKKSSVYRNASPIRRIHSEAPPFMLLQGTADVLTPPSGARDFERKLKLISKNPVRYHEVPRGIHAFDLFDTQQTASAVDAAYDFLTDCYVEDGLRRAV